MKKKMLITKIDTFVKSIEENSDYRCYISYDIYHDLLYSCNMKFENNESVENKIIKKISLKWKSGRKNKINLCLSEVHNKEFEKDLIRIDCIIKNDAVVYKIGTIDNRPLLFEK